METSWSIATFFPRPVPPFPISRPARAGSAAHRLPIRAKPAGPFSPCSMKSRTRLRRGPPTPQSSSACASRCSARWMPKPGALPARRCRSDISRRPPSGKVAMSGLRCCAPGGACCARSPTSRRPGVSNCAPCERGGRSMPAPACWRPALRHTAAHRRITGAGCTTATPRPHRSTPNQTTIRSSRPTAQSDPMQACCCLRSHGPRR